MNRGRVATAAMLFVAAGIALATKALGDGPAAAPDAAVRVTGSGPAKADRFLLCTTIDDRECMHEVLAMGRSAGASEVDRLAALATAAPDPMVAGTAIAALARLGAFRATPQLLPLLEDPRSRVREEALVAAGASGDRMFVSQLAAQLQRDSSAPLVIQALGRLGSREAREALVALDASTLGPVALAFRSQALARCEVCTSTPAR